MSRDTLNQRRAVSILFLIGSFLLVVAAWNLPDYERRRESAATIAHDLIEP
jgi:hypothetical protein